jgi:hypothetical protein
VYCYGRRTRDTTDRPEAAARFHSLEELLAFMVRVLTDVQRPSGAD